MKLAISFLLLTISFFAKGQNIDSANIRFDGFYKTDTSSMVNDKAIYRYLRFYSTGDVIATSSTGTPNDLKGWFNLTKQDLPTGNYKMTGDSLYFSATVKNEGSVIYRGKVKDKQSLTLYWKSLINGNTGEDIYYFVEIPDLN